MISDVSIIILCFVGIWVGSGLIISSVDSFSNRIKVSSFTVSFFILGILTSIPEIFIGINATILNDPPVFVGNLLGGVIVIFLLVVPTFGIISKGIILNHELNKGHLLQILITIAAPMFLIVNNEVNVYEGFLLVLLYVLLIYSISKKQSLFENLKSNFKQRDVNSLYLVLLIILGIIILTISSNFIVRSTLNIAYSLRISEFILSLLALAFGTNLPELSVAIRSAYSGKKDIALGDYLGSAAANTLIFGILIIVNKGIKIEGNFIVIFVSMILSLSLFFFFIRSKDQLSRNESIVLLFLYLIFILIGIQQS